VGTIEVPRVGRGTAPSPEKNFDFGSQIGEFWCTGCLLHSSPKSGLSAIPTVKITLGTPFPGVAAGSDPCYK